MTASETMTDGVTPTTRTGRYSRWLRFISGAVAILFGFMTLKEGGSVLFGAGLLGDGGSAAAAAGHFVPFVVWFNFIAGFAYVTAGVALIAGKRLALHLALAIAAGTALTLVAFAIHAFSGGAYESRTAVALPFRVSLWCLIAWVAARTTTGEGAQAS